MTDVNVTSVSAIICFILLNVIIYQFVVYPAFLSPLSKIPNAHILSAITPLWIYWKRYQNLEIETVDAAHLKYGSVVRLGPNDLSINCIDNGIRTVYGGGFEKSQWYNFFINYGVRNTFSSLGPEHATHRRRVSNVYSKSFLQASAHISSITMTILYARLLPIFAKCSLSTEPFDILELSFAYGLDLVSAFFFGLSQSTNFIQEERERTHFLEQYLKSHGSRDMFWLQEFPNLTAWLSKIGIDIAPRSRITASHDLEDWCLSLCDAAEKTLQSGDEIASGNLPIVYQQLKMTIAKEIWLPNVALLPDLPTPQKLELASELLDHLVATRDTFGITFTYVVFEISRHPSIQLRLRQEFEALSTPLKYPAKDPQLPGAKELEMLPLLNAVIKESLRLRSTAPTGNPRLTPCNAATSLGSFTNIPSNVRVNAFAWCLHRNPHIFSDPEQWQPERWLNVENDEGNMTTINKREKWFWAFGSGSRMCMGSNLALQMIRYGITAIYSNFTTKIVDDARFGNKDGFVTGDRDEKLLVQFEPV